MSFPLDLKTFFIQNQKVEVYVPHAGSVKDAYQRGEIAFPYWSQVWPAAKALAQFLLINPDYTAGKTVVELGAGLGLPSMIAARHAAHVLCTDHVPDAIQLVTKSADHAGLKNFTASVLDWQYMPKNIRADVLLLSDINYEPEAFTLLLTAVKSFLLTGTTIILSTPQRLIAKDFIASLLADCVRQEEVIVSHEGTNVAIMVMVLERKRLVT